MGGIERASDLGSGRPQVAGKWRVSCKVPDCAKTACNSRGWCWKHYMRWKRHGDPVVTLKIDMRERFAMYAPVDLAADACWNWTGPLDASGYGSCGPERAHRASYIINHGPIPDGLHILHSCDNRACVNPAHLRAGTHQDNMRDMAVRDRVANKSRICPGPVWGMALDGLSPSRIARVLGLPSPMAAIRIISECPVEIPKWRPGRRPMEVEEWDNVIEMEWQHRIDHPGVPLYAEGTT